MRKKRSLQIICFFIIGIIFLIPLFSFKIFMNDNCIYSYNTKKSFKILPKIEKGTKYSFIIEEEEEIEKDYVVQDFFVPRNFIINRISQLNKKQIKSILNEIILFREIPIWLKYRKILI